MKTKHALLTACIFWIVASLPSNCAHAYADPFIRYTMTEVLTDKDRKWLRQYAGNSGAIVALPGTPPFNMGIFLWKNGFARIVQIFPGGAVMFHIHTFVDAALKENEAIR